MRMLHEFPANTICRHCGATKAQHQAPFACYDKQGKPQDFTPLLVLVSGREGSPLYATKDAIE